MGKTSDLTVVQKTIIDTLHKEGKTQKVMAERAGCSQSTVSKHIHGMNKCGKKRCTSNRDMTASLRRLSSKTDSRTWGSFTKYGLRLKSVHQEPPCTDVFGKRDTTVAFLVSSHSWTRDNVRSVLPGLRRKRTGPLLSGPKSSFQMKVNFAFHLEIKVPESEGRMEKDRSPVWRFRSRWWFGVPCHLLVLLRAVFYQVQS